MISKIVKRDGNEAIFNSEKIYNVIKLAFNKNGIENESIVKSVFEEVMSEVMGKDTDTIGVEEVQDCIQKVLMRNGYYTIAVKFIVYRFRHEDKRDLKKGLFKSVQTICKVTDRENANVGHGPSSKMLQIAESTSGEFQKEELTDKVTLDAINRNEIYPHDATWGPIGTTTCTFLPLGKFLDNGFNTGHGFIRSPKRIRTAAQLSCIAIQSNQNDQHGGQAFGWYDRDLANTVKREFEWQTMNIMNTLAKLHFIEPIAEEYVKVVEDLDYNSLDLDDMCDLIYREREIVDNYYKELKSKYQQLLNNLDETLQENIRSLAWENTENETIQAMEAVVHNLNSMHSRAGAQVPFSSVNIGTDTTKEGRLIAKCLLLAYEKGLGKSEQPLFPNICFKVKSGVNFEPESPNFDLLLLSLRVSSKRLFPTFNFQDSVLNRDFPEDVPTMGCRTNVRWNRHATRQTCEERGNLSFTSSNLPNIALNTKLGVNPYSKGDIVIKFNEIARLYEVNLPSEYMDNSLVKEFFIKLNENLDMIINQLLERFKYQCTFKKRDFPFLMSGSWMGSENLKDNDDLYEVLKHGTLGIGFIGLAEALKCLVDKHHGECEVVQRLGIEIVKFIDMKAKKSSDRHNLNFAVIATPAEGLTGKLLSKDKKHFGVINGVTDKDWYTNSYHVPVEYEISIFDKIKIEGAYSKYCGGGSITYVELDQSPLGNIDAYYEIIKAMYEADVVYGAINFPCDRCRECGLFGVIESNCPKCGSEDISRIRRITGYLAEDKNFNFAKSQETKNRVIHLRIASRKR